METSLLKTKLFIPPLRPETVARPRLVEGFAAGLRLKLAIVCAPAGYGKTTLVSEGVRSCRMPVGWVSLDEGDNDPVRFWTYFIAALQTVRADMGKSIIGLLQSPQPPPTESFLTGIINEISEVSEEFALVLDDYHIIEAPPIHDALTFLLDHLPSQMHMVIASRVDPPISLARMRARGQLTEMRAADLRFTLEEATAFLNGVMGLELSEADVTALESRTEGWVASLQLSWTAFPSPCVTPLPVATTAVKYWRSWKPPVYFWCSWMIRDNGIAITTSLPTCCAISFCAHSPSA